MPFTFKKQKKEGRYKSFQKDFTDIKLKKKAVGYIAQEETFSYRVSFAIKKEKTKSDPAPFKWITFKKRFKTEKRARKFANKNFNEIIEKFDLHKFEKE
uniref:Uncharacterized protein n=1 Tax=viral metagenome TaxID=1070528 RepID=A0A6M3L0A0_9ZZZZ